MKKMGKKAMLSALAITVGAAAQVSAVENAFKDPLFSLKELGTKSVLLAHAEGKCGEGKCGEGKCGGKKATTKAKSAESKCGEGNCGGKSGKKFMSKKFEEYVLSISKNSLIEQKEMLEKEFMEWKGNYEQVDDVTVIGIRI